MILPIFPAQALDSSVITTVWIGLWVITLLNLRFGTSLAGLVVPGYLVPLLLLKPTVAYVIWAEAMATYALTRLLADQLMRCTGSSTMFGRDRFFALLLISVFVRVVSDGWVLPALGRALTEQGFVFDYHNNLQSFGLVIVALTANQMWNAGATRGTATLVLYVGLTYLIVRGLLIPYTNFDLAGLGFLYEGIATDIFASPKAYLILLTTAFIASRMNLHYGWEFSGILIPALLALQWFQPSKLVISLVEAGVIFALGRLALHLPVFRRMNMEGSRLLLLFFTVSYLYKLALGYALGAVAPSAKPSDYFAFGYLLSTLIAVKMHQKQITWQISRTTVQTSLMGVAAASLVGFALAAAWPDDGGTRGEANVQRTAPAPDAGPTLIEQLATRRRAFYASEAAASPLSFSASELADFAAGLRALVRYRDGGRAETLASARRAFQRGGFIVDRNGDWLVVGDADPSRGAGLYALNLRPRTQLTVATPAPLDEPGTFEAALHLASVEGHAAFASAGTRRARLPQGQANVLRNPNLPFAHFHAIAAGAGVLHVRGLATAHGEDARAQLWIQRALPPGLDLVALAARTGPLDSRYDRRPVRNPLRDATSAPYAELLLARPARLRLIARTLGSDGLRRVDDARRIDGYLYAWLVERRGAIAGRGSNRYEPPRRGDLLYLQTEVLQPLQSVALQWSTARDLVALRAIDSAASTLGYRVVLHRHVGTSVEHAILTEAPGGHRQWGTVVVRLGEASPYIVEIPRPASERHTFEYGTRLFARLGARALMVAGAHFAVRADGRGDVLDPNNPLTAFNMAHQTLLTALPGPPWVLQVRGRLDVDETPSPDVVAGFVGKPARDTDATRVGGLLAALRLEGDSVAFAGSAPMARHRYAGTDAQARFVRSLGGARMLTLSVSGQARLGYRDRLVEDPDAARFAAAGVPSVREDVARRILHERFGAPPSARTRALVDIFVQNGNVAALAAARRDMSSIQRMIDLGSGRTFLRIAAPDGRTAAWRALDRDTAGFAIPMQRAAFATGSGAWLQEEAPP